MEKNLLKNLIKNARKELRSVLDLSLLILVRVRRRLDENLWLKFLPPIFSLSIDPEPVHASSEEEESSEILLLPRSRRTKGPAVVTTETLLEEAT